MIMFAFEPGSPINGHLGVQHLGAVSVNVLVLDSSGVVHHRENNLIHCFNLHHAGICHRYR